MADEQGQNVGVGDASQLQSEQTSGGEPRPGTEGTAAQDFGIKPPNPTGEPTEQVPGVEP